MIVWATWGEVLHMATASSRKTHLRRMISSMVHVSKFLIHMQASAPTRNPKRAQGSLLVRVSFIAFK